jgi:hypothetical protein
LTTASIVHATKSDTHTVTKSDNPHHGALRGDAVQGVRGDLLLAQQVRLRAVERPQADPRESKLKPEISFQASKGLALFRNQAPRSQLHSSATGTGYILTVRVSALNEAGDAAAAAEYAAAEAAAEVAEVGVFTAVLVEKKCVAVVFAKKGRRENIFIFIVDGDPGDAAGAGSVIVGGGGEVMCSPPATCAPRRQTLREPSEAARRGAECIIFFVLPRL